MYWKEVRSNLYIIEFHIISKVNVRWFKILFDKLLFFPSLETDKYFVKSWLILTKTFIYMRDFVNIYYSVI